MISSKDLIVINTKRLSGWDAVKLSIMEHNAQIPQRQLLLSVGRNGDFVECMQPSFIQKFTRIQKVTKLEAGMARPLILNQCCSQYQNSVEARKIMILSWFPSWLNTGHKVSDEENAFESVTWNPMPKFLIQRQNLSWHKYKITSVHSKINVYNVNVWQRERF